MLTTSANARADATIQAAQAAVVDNVSIFAGANTDTINSGRNANIHFAQDAGRHRGNAVEDRVRDQTSRCVAVKSACC